METKEIWKRVVINGEEYNYDVSNLGRVKSYFYSKVDGRILKHGEALNGYMHVVLRRNGKSMTINVHKLVAIAFLNHKQQGMDMTINHIDGNKKNNSVTNLEEMTPRENNIDCIKRIGGTTSNFTGVYWNKASRKWHAQIKLNEKITYLGLFECEKDAGNAYKTALKNHVSNGGI